MDTIQVCIRIRPLNKRHSLCWSRVENSLVNSETKCRFAFDAVFDETNDYKIYNRVQDLIFSVMNGFNATVIAYGQTSSGKTHTMIGNEKERGIITKSIDDIFKIINNVLSTNNCTRILNVNICYEFAI